ncbi:hypothetical protein CIHG_05658 [Coccidioides immitis H538.4]|uniref:Uncharacterized protein n=3 Tax=Coccidioides immitis TaxID=5501 RepID=A0A0J8R4W8_COCIT|nr:hypothetical protein CIRG_08443 [Coccidioides immitis RMSCC 2394]KMU78753.1 hypothetical protein CISG_01793 [Coccidioides immitis RMSCC 3703]KMU87891.1 hypothetical protein CIHG_05658 [Coccidioides immitis H538.4]
MSKKKLIFTTITTWTTGTPSSSPLPTHFLAKPEHAHHVFQWKRHTLSDQSATRQSKCRPRTPCILVARDSSCDGCQGSAQNKLSTPKTTEVPGLCPAVK